MSSDEDELKSINKNLPSDPETGEVGPVRDMREAFAELTRKTPRDPEAERAFILTKMETVKNDPGLSDEEKAEIIESLKKILP